MTELCAFDDLPEPGAKGPFTVDGVSVFLVRKDNEVFGYVNSCPHVGAPLEMEPDRFLDAWGEAIVCSVHGANFHIETGACLGGPCRGKGLTAYPVTVRNGKVMSGPPSEGI
ncbi:MAG: Rieske (2Fe-2S) protein [Pseudomonadota bacterium]